MYSFSVSPSSPFVFCFLFISFICTFSIISYFLPFLPRLLLKCLPDVSFIILLLLHLLVVPLLPSSSLPSSLYIISHNRQCSVIWPLPPDEWPPPPPVEPFSVIFSQIIGRKSELHHGNHKMGKKYLKLFDQ